MTLLAYNEKVQQYNAAPDRKYKKNRLTSLISIVQSAGYVFERLFTNAKQRVLDEIIYLLSGSGICKVGGEHLAKKCGVSIRTVRATISAIKKTGEFEVGRIANRHAGKYIFVDKAHADYDWIMHDVFGVNAPLDARQDAPLQNAESLARVSVEDENDALNGFNSLNLLKQANKNNNIYDAFEKENNNVEYVDQYATNPLQHRFYKLMDMLPLPALIRDNMALLALRLGADATTKTLKKANSLIMHMALRLRDGYVYNNVVAAFSEGLRKAMLYDEKPYGNQPPVLYNWLRQENPPIHYDWILNK
ncbi:hypothetical protein [Rummeliibacillus sp. TYF-LIM-RU47]|uniref:hypothetical protein n=1 Tax=Rummeliibacillus sp. TYF-LIM-RU47 TaxID=2608406 RepID=UPI001238AAAF|nr:hypothetical protein [Rummeliibacillus sp. TYF-LIM-RU47]